MATGPQHEELREATITRESEAEQQQRFEAGVAVRQSSLWRDALRRFLANRAATIALAAFLVLGLYVLIVPFVSPYDPYAVDFSQAYQTPNLHHLLGTDQFGRDLFLRTALGGRVSIGIGFAGTFAIMLMGIVYGSISGFAGGWLDNAMMRVLDALYGLPYLPFAIIVTQIFGVVNFWVMVFALTIASWFTTARVMRGQVISLKQIDYVRAAGAIGARWYRVLFRHI
ncbi:MAG: ABC transporter permease, partial [Gaiellaceae bacterium]